MKSCSSGRMQLSATRDSANTERYAHRQKYKVSQNASEITHLWVKNHFGCFSSVLICSYGIYELCKRQMASTVSITSHSCGKVKPQCRRLLKIIQYIIYIFNNLIKPINMLAFVLSSMFLQTEPVQMFNVKTNGLVWHKDPDLGPRWLLSCMLVIKLLL